MRCVAALAASLVLVSPTALAAAPTVTDLVEVAELSSLSVAPDGRWAAVREDRASIAGNDYELTWWVVDTRGEKPPIRVGGAGGALFTHAGVVDTQKPQWSADSKWVYYRALVDGAVQVWRARADGAAVEQVTHDAADVVDFRLDPASLSLTYTTGEPRDAIVAAERAEYDRGIVVDGTISPGQNIFRGMLINGRMASQRLSGQWFVRQGLLDHLPLHERRLDSRGAVEEVGRKPRSTSPAAVTAANERLVAARAGGDVAFVTGFDQPSIFLRPPSGSPTQCLATACGLRRVYELAWLPGESELLIHGGNAQREHVLVVWNPATGRARALARHDGVLGANQEGEPDCDVAASAVICSVEDATGPGRLEAIELKSGRRTVLLDPSREVRARLAMPTERLLWSAGGYDFAGRLFLPQGAPGAKPAPLFIQYYACNGYLRGGVGDEYPFAVLASQGIAALCINSVSPRNMTPETHDAMLTYTIGVAGIREIVRQLGGRGLIDTAKVGMGGLSFGSEVTMRTLVETDLLSAAVISSVQIEPIYYWFNRMPGRDFLKQLRQSWGLGAPEETPERWKQVSDAANAHRINAPLLMQLPEQESRYNYELFGRIQMRNVPVEMIVFPEEPHIKFQPRHKAAVYERNVDWFRFWLKDEVDPAPSKKAQYDRWRAMASAWRKAGAHRGGAGGPATD